MPWLTIVDLTKVAKNNSSSCFGNCKRHVGKSSIKGIIARLVCSYCNQSCTGNIKAVLLNSSRS